MAEEKKVVVELRKEDRELLQSVTKSLKEGLAHRESKPELTKDAHKSIEEAVNCPNCYPSIKKLVLPKVWNETRNLDYECKECGLGVNGKESEKEEWNCPQCGSKYAKEREA